MEKDKIIEELILVGKKTGKLTETEIQTAFEDIDLEKEDVFAIYEIITKSGVEIEEEDDLTKEFDDLDDDKEEKKEEGDDSPKAAKSSTRSAKRYLSTIRAHASKEIGRVALLTKEEEVELRKRMEAEMKKPKLSM